MHRALDLGAGYVGQSDFREQFEGGHKGQRFARFVTFRLDARITGNFELLLGDGFAKGTTDDVIQRFVAGLQAVLLFDHLGRHLARTETCDLQGLAHARQTRVGCGFEFLGGDGQINRPLERIGFLHGFGGAHRYS